MIDIKEVLFQWFYNIFEKSAATCTGTESFPPINSNSCYENQQLANGLHKSITRKFKKHKVYAFF